MKPPNSALAFSKIVCLIVAARFHKIKKHIINDVVPETDQTVGGVLRFAQNCATFVWSAVRDFHSALLSFRHRSRFLKTVRRDFEIRPRSDCLADVLFRAAVLVEILDIRADLH